MNPTVARIMHNGVFLDTRTGKHQAVKLKRTNKIHTTTGRLSNEVDKVSAVSIGWILYNG